MRLSEIAAFGAILAVLVSPVRAEPPAPSNTLRVCADPNNLPFSNQAKQGFENKLADMIAAKLDKTLAYIWWAQRRGFIRHTLKAGDCDLVIGVPAHYGLVETTKPYYRSTYVFVTRTDRHLDLASMLDPRLAQLNIGVHLIGNDGNNPPPAEALGERGIVDNVHGYMLYGDYREPNPPARLIDAVADGEIDLAAAWGPLAGYFAARSSVPLTVTAIVDGERFAPQRFTFAIAMGVRKGDDGLRDQLNAFIDDNRAEITSLLKSYNVPLVDLVQAASGEH